VRRYLPLARIGDSVPPEVPIDIAVLHEIAPCNAYRADDDFPPPEGGSGAWARSFYKNSER